MVFWTVLNRKIDVIINNESNGRNMPEEIEEKEKRNSKWLVKY